MCWDRVCLSAWEKRHYLAISALLKKKTGLLKHSNPFLYPSLQSRWWPLGWKDPVLCCCKCQPWHGMERRARCCRCGTHSEMHRGQKWPHESSWLLRRHEKQWCSQSSRHSAVLQEQAESETQNYSDIKTYTNHSHTLHPWAHTITTDLEMDDPQIASVTHLIKWNRQQNVISKTSGLIKGDANSFKAAALVCV